MRRLAPEKRSPSRRQASLQAKGLAVIALPVVALMVSGMVSLAVEARERRAESEVARTHEIHVSAEGALKLLVDAETGLRGYLLTSDAAFLQPYENARGRIGAALAALDAKVQDRTARRQLERIGRLVENQMSMLAQQRTAHDGGMAVSTESLRASKSAMDTLRTDFAELGRREEELLERRQGALNHVRGLQLAAGAASVVLGVVGGLVAVWLFTRGLARRVRGLVREGADGEVDQDQAHAGDEVDQARAVLARSKELVAQREAELREAREFLEHVIAAGPMVVIRARPDTQAVEWASPNITRILGYEPEEAVQDPDFWRERLHPEDGPQVQRQFDQAVASGQDWMAMEYRFRHGDGTYRWLSITALLSYPDSGSAPPEMFGYVLDITERQAAEEAALAGADTLQSLFAASPDPISLLDVDGKVQQASPVMASVLGRNGTASEWEGDLLSEVHPEDRSDVVGVLEELVGGHRDDAIARHRIRHATGGWLILESHARRMAHPDGSTRGIAVVSRDVTKQAMLERELVQAKDLAEEANRAKTEFLSRMSHELRTPLNAIIGFGQLLEKADTLLPEDRGDVEQILKAGRHLLGLIDEVLDIARIEAGRMTLSLEPVGVGEAIAQVVDLIRPLAQERGVEVAVGKTNAIQRSVPTNSV